MTTKKTTAKRTAKKVAKKTAKRRPARASDPLAVARDAAVASVPGRWWDDLHALPGFDPCRDVLLADGSACVFCAELADRVVAFFEAYLRHVKGPLGGRLLTLEAWQRGLLGNLYGWVLTGTPGGGRDGLRRFQTADLFVARKNGKSYLAAGMILYGLLADGEAGAELYVGAADKEQACIIYDVARAIVRADPELTAALQVYKAQQGRKIVHEDSGSGFVPLSSDGDNKDGYSPSVFIADELHAHKDSRLCEVMRSGMGVRAQPLYLQLTTAGHDPSSYCFEQWQWSRRVLRGEITEPTHLPAVFEPDEGDDPADPATWAKANPNMGVAFPESFIAQQLKKATEQPRHMGEFLRKHCNVWAEDSDTWIPADAWDACAGYHALGIEDDGAGGHAPRKGAEALRGLMERSGRHCVMGADLSRSVDLTAVCFLFPPLEGEALEDYRDALADGGHSAADLKALSALAERWVPVPYVFAPEEGARRKAREDQAPYLEWHAAGLIELTEGEVIDYGVLERRIVDLGERYRCRSYAFDPAHAQNLTQRLMEEHGLDVVYVKQTRYHMSDPTKRFEALVLGGALAHGGHPALRYCVLNATLSADDMENVRPDKKRSRGRIDAATATIIALAVAQTGGATEPERSVYETRGLLDLSEGLGDGADASGDGWG